MDFKGRRVLITGASSGIGEALAREFARRGSELILVARSKQRLHAVAEELRTRGATAHVVVCDLCSSGAVGELCEQLSTLELTVDFLVNNAGVGRARDLASDDRSEVVSMLELNMVALTELSMALLPGMMERGVGGILFLGSVVGHFPVPKMAAYAASKAYVLRLSEALRQELRHEPIFVSVLCPGQVPTRFQVTAGFRDGAGHLPGEMEADELARRAVEGFSKRRARIVPGLLNQLTVWAVGLVPGAWVARIAGAVLQRAGRFQKT